MKYEISSKALIIGLIVSLFEVWAATRVYVPYGFVFAWLAHMSVTASAIAAITIAFKRDAK